MKRRVLVVVPENGRFVCATILEDGQMRVRMSDDWQKELDEEKKELGFRVFVPPHSIEVEEDLPYFVWPPTWTPFDQNYWLQYFQEVVKGGLELPALLLKDLDFIVKCLLSKPAKDWSLVKIKGNPKFTKLYAVLLGFKAMAELRRNKFPGIQVEMTEREGSPNSPIPGGALSTAF